MRHLTRCCLMTVAVLWLGCSSAPQVSVPEHPVHITNLGPAVNSDADDFAPTLTANGNWLYFTSNRATATGGGLQDFWTSTRDGGFWGTPVNVGAPVNTAASEGTSSIAADGQELFFAACGRTGRGCDLFSARLRGRAWEDIAALPAPVSTDSWESQPCISSDGRELWFVSDRPGGIGGLDLWIARRDADGHWGSVTNAGRPINTERDELAPVIASDGGTVYFASNGHPGLGGTDLFVSRRDNARWTQPVNLGRPINSADNDEFLALAAEGGTLYFASKREGGSGGLDLYEATPNPHPPGAVLVMSGVVRDRITRRPLEARIEVVDSLTGESRLVQASNAYTGEYILVLPQGRVHDVRITAPGRRDAHLTRDLRALRAYREERQDILLDTDEPRPALFATVTTDVLESDFSLITGARATAGLTIEDVISRESIPLLPYIFFDDSTAIPARYTRAGADGVDRFSLHGLRQGTIPTYRAILDIIGSRLRLAPKATLTLAGIHDDADAAGARGPALRRAEAVRDYLVTAWHIDPARMQTTARASSDRMPIGAAAELREEQRRVELAASDPGILAPIRHLDTVRALKPPRALFHPGVVAEAGVRSWTLRIDQGGRSLWQRSGTGAPPDSIGWDWRSTDGTPPDAHEPVLFRLDAEDTRGTTTRSETGSIPVQSISLEQKALQHLPDRTVEKLSLILFDYDRATISPQHEESLRETIGRITPGSQLVIRGYTDALGSGEYNRNLAERRADAVRNHLARAAAGATMRVEAIGESLLLHPNTSPEERFYCRTVQVLVETTIRR